MLAPACPARPGSGNSRANNLDLPDYTRLRNYKSLKQSSFDRTGGNRDSFHIAPGESLQVFRSNRPGVVTHIWFTISARSGHHLKELVLRMYWDGNVKPQRRGAGG